MLMTEVASYGSKPPLSLFANHFSNCFVSALEMALCTPQMHRWFCIAFCTHARRFSGSCRFSLSKSCCRRSIPNWSSRGREQPTLVLHLAQIALPHRSVGKPGGGFSLGMTSMSTGLISLRKVIKRRFATVLLVPFRRFHSVHFTPSTLLRLSGGGMLQSP